MIGFHQTLVLKASSASAGLLACRSASGCPMADAYKKNSSFQKSNTGPDNIVKPFSEIPGPRPLPLIHNIWRYTPLFGEYNFKYTHHTYSRMLGKFGTVVREKLLPGKQMVHAFDPNDIKEVYEINDDNPTRHTHQALIKYRLERPHIFKTTGAFLSNGPEWRRMRDQFAPMFVENDIQVEYSKIMETISKDLINMIPNMLNHKNEVDFMPWLSKWAIETFGSIALDVRLGCVTEGGELAEQFIKAAHDTHYCVYITEIFPLYKYFRTPAYRRLEKAQDFVAGVVSNYMFGGAKMGADALITKMLKIGEKNNENDVFVMTQDMFLAGIDTMSNTTAFAFYNLAKNQRVQNKLREMLMKEMPTKSCPLSPSIDTMTYLHSIVKETLRVNPVAFGNGRVNNHDLNLSGYKVPPQTQVILQHLVASYNPEYFPHPQVFWPERWEEESETPLYHPIAYAPFGFGARGCLGKKIALRQMALVLGCAVRNYKITYHHENIDMACRLVNVPDRPLLLRFTPVEK